MPPTISHVLHIMFIGAAISFPVCLFLAAVAMRGLDMLDGRGPTVSRSQTSPTLRGAGHRALRSGGGR